ncbi:MAG: arylesterase, partial [Lewinellaceae bacterium]|nr:arylesterase [Lewinellaceae bacterium]
MDKLLLLSVILLLFSACGSNESKAPDNGAVSKPAQSAAKPAEARRNIVFFGNSLTAAY